MSDARDEHIEMRQHALDDDSLDRLLSGRIPPDDAPPGLSSVAALFCVASGPATAEELDREAEVVTAGALAIRNSRTQSASLKRRSPMLAKMISAKFAAAAAVAVLGAGTTAAAATGNLPTQRLHSVHAHHAHLASRHHSTIGTIPAGSASAGHSPFGLCTAFLASAQRSGRNASAPPFKALIAAHGGLAGTTTFCRAFVAAHHPGTSPTSTSSTMPVVSTTAPLHRIPAGSASTGHRTFGLCTAYLASSQGSGHSASAPPFKALIAAHGGPAGTTSFCHAFVTAHHPGMSTTSTSSTTPVVTSTAPRHDNRDTDHGMSTHTPISMIPGHPATTQPPVSTGPATTEPPATSTSPATAGNAPVGTPEMGGTNNANSASGGNRASGSNQTGAASGGASSSGSAISSNQT